MLPAAELLFSFCGLALFYKISLLNFPTLRINKKGLKIIVSQQFVVLVNIFLNLVFQFP